MFRLDTYHMDKNLYCDCSYENQSYKIECFKKHYKDWITRRNSSISEVEINSNFSIDSIIKLSFKNCQTEIEKYGEMIILWSFLQEYGKKHPFLGQIIHDLPYSDKINEFQFL